MVIDATDKFACQHEFVSMVQIGLPQMLHCTKCQLDRLVSPIPDPSKRSLIFFPVREQLTDIAREA